MKMRWELLSLVALWLIVVYSYASPIKQSNPVVKKTVDSVVPVVPIALKDELSKKDPSDSRQARQQTPAAAAPEDDDDDDDDDDLDVGLDDDDDDDDDDSPAAAADEDDDEDDDYFGGLFDDILGDDDDDDDEEDETPAAVAQPVAVQPIQPAEPAVPEDIAEEIQEEGVTDGTPLADGLDSDLVDKDPAASVEQPVQNLVVQQPIVVEPVPATVDDDDDDDDDDDEDALDEIAGDDDDDDDDDDAAADDDDDDEDDDELDDLADGDIIDARKARALSTDPVTAAKYVSKYNRFVDNIISRVNRILRRSYDPVRVKLSSTSNSKKSKTKKKKNNPRQSAEPAVSSRRSKDLHFPTAPEQRANNQNKQKKQKPKVKQAKPTQKARATLYGLSSIKRDGDVAVNLMSDHTTVRTDFAVGPLTLRVEKEFGKGARRELKSATATTAEMRGKLSLRVSNDGQAKLHSIRVLQPKQVRVESPDEHDRTREFIWRRSSHIAHLVSQKLATATRSMLKPSAKSVEATKKQQ